ncbi:MAG: 2-dehydropantoate 2-reductase [Candidatus Omnitrophica bacterium]|nr:2-dehydropantoate 2-reductase [Candidatus Omnitrophota bacterium]MCF7895312.1 2-dehydropantoate 2-reductase [Candidatus Omnitrophota bacterium]
MQIAVLGCGAIGGLFLGHLSKELEDVLGIVRSYQVDSLENEGLVIKDSNKEEKINVKIDTKLTKQVDLAIVSTKINDLEEIIKENIDYLKNAVVISTQNGLRAESILVKFFPAEKIITTIVMFGATFYSPNKVVSNFSGDLIMGNIFDKKVAKEKKIRKVLKNSFNLKLSENIKGAKYLKLFINLNNCIPAILGKSMQEAFRNPEIAKLAIKLNKEAYQLISQAGISLESLPSYPKERIEGLVSMPLEDAASLFSKIMINLSKEPLYGSLLQSIKRGKPSEIDYINGEVVALAKNNNQQAPLNEKMVSLVHRVEKEGFLSENELLLEIKGAENEKQK